jgi:ABC-type transport system involved in cytochrome c biogenesis ATPase subunit
MVAMASGAISDKQRENGALLIAASIVAAIRLRGQEVTPSPRLTAVVKDSVALARLVLAELSR